MEAILAAVMFVSLAIAMLWSQVLAKLVAPASDCLVYYAHAALEAQPLDLTQFDWKRKSQYTAQRMTSI